MKKTLLLSVLGLLLAWTLAAQLPYSWWMLYFKAQSADHIHIPFTQETYTKTIHEVRPSYEAAGLRVGDEVVSLNGVAVDGDEQEAQLWVTARPNDTLRVTVRRRTEGIKTLAFRLQPRPNDASEWPLIIIASVILPITCLLVGFYIAFARPTDPLAWITMAMLASFSQAEGNHGMGSLIPLIVPSPWREFLFVHQAGLGDTWPLWMVLFALYFPLPFPWIKRKPWIGWVLALPSILLMALDLFGDFEQLHHLDRIQWLARAQSLLNTPQTIWFTLLVFGFFGLLGWKTRTLTNPDARRRLGVMSTGCSYALTPSLLVVGSQIHWLPRLPLWLVAACLSMLILFPITMAYVIVVQRAMDVRMVIRSGVQHAFAANGIVVLQRLILTGVVIETLRLTREADRRGVEIFIAAIGLLLVFTVRRLTEWAKLWLDKRFFREAYSAEKLLTELSNSVAGIRDVKELLETVTRRISESLHVPSIAVLLDLSGAYRTACVMGPRLAGVTVAFQPDTSVVKYLKRERAPARIFFGDPQSWVHGTPDEEQAKLRQLDTQVLLPVTLKNRLLGIISLSGKRSEEPYSRADLQLLGAVASQTGLALENAELTESVRTQIAQRERLDRELEIARDVQQRLFPQKLPIVNGLDFAGYCRPAEGVGGDYYDFIHLPDRSLGIAVGDVSGKGIAAALMMASLQASLRGQTIKPCETLSEMIQHINGLMYEASEENRYATFFYAQYDPVTRAMRYVNAGHNAPMVWRQSDGRHEFIRLEEGGTVVGLFPDSPFREGVVQLEKGDVVVAFTDGVSEAMNGADEEFEEERLMAALRGMKSRTAAETISQILAEVDGFTDGAQQHDDMTVVVVRVQ